MLRICSTFNDERVYGLFDCHFLNSWARTKIQGVLEWWSVGLYKTSITTDKKTNFKKCVHVVIHTIFKDDHNNY